MRKAPERATQLPHRLQQNRGSVGTSEQAPEESVGDVSDPRTGEIAGPYCRGL